MKKMSRKNFRAGPLFSSKSSSASSTPTPGSSSSPAGGGGGIMRRATWADKIRDKLPPLGENEYEVLWERGVLGVIFLESEKDGIPYVSKATESCISPAVSQGDILKFVNVVRSKDHSFSDFFKILATMKKPVLLRFERVSASTPSSDEDEASQLFGVPRSSSTNAMNSASHYGGQSSTNADEGDPTGKLSRANSVPQKDQKPPKAMRGAFWRATSAKDSVGPANPAAQSVGPGGVSGGSDRLGASRRLPSNRDQVSPRDLAATNGGGGQSSLQSPLGTHEYQVYWETGSLGLFFGEDRSTNLPVVTRSTPSANPVVRRAVAINDTLVSANGIRSADYTFEAFFGRLQQMNKPSSPQFNMSPRASPNIGSSPKVTSSPFTSPMSPFIAAEVGSESNGRASSSPVDEVDDDTPDVPSPIETEEETVQAQKENPQKFENARGNRSRNTSEEQRLQRTSIPVHEEESVLSPLRKPTHLSPTEPWDLPEQILSPTIKAEPVIVVDEDEDGDVDITVPVSPSSGIHVETAAVAQEAELIEEAEEIEEAEVIEEAGLAEETEIVEDAEFAEEVDFDDEAELAVEAGLAEQAEPVLPSLPVDNSSDDNADLDDVEVGMLADVEVGVAVDEAEAEVVESTTSEHDRNSSPWDLEPEPERKKAHLHESNTASPHDEHSPSSTGKPSIDSAVEASEVDFTDASESDEFANDPDISGDIDSVDGDIMMQEAPKDKVDSASPPKPSKSSLHANLAKYKKKGKTARGVSKLPALTEEEALTVPLVAPNAVNTTVQVRGRPKPKLTMADTPDSTTYLIKWKENRSIGLQLKEVRFAKGTYPLVMDVCQEPCCELLRHICVGDVIIEINGRNTSTMGVKKTVNFLKTCTKTTLMKIRHGPAFVTQRVSATV
ncbi:hypothetical protein PR002_g15991 [Phytophthora rubi]|uniref:PDZ domain-containing protein n=1 Tax=Phytophthora rubi TaxID=129364 RepID=A0A6A3KMI5_9STRA|nr:hypothetical protein PR002_g15991 [Phytophthora rubi]